MQDYNPSGLDARFPGAKQIKHGWLTAIGPFAEAHGDGHEKLGAHALCMGNLGIPIYGISSLILWRNFG